MPASIRPAAAADHAAWARLRAALWPQGGDLAGELEALSADPGFRGWLAWEDGEAVGFIEAALRPFANGCEGRPVPFVEGLYVLAPRRRQGIGRALVQAVEAWARAQGFRELGSDVELDNLVSQDAHRGLGFVETERVVYFRKAL
jgi:aminoglycoside 6'-N-acetyltransferase I